MAKTLILCVDDDVLNLNIRDLVLREAGYDTLIAKDANSGLRLFGNSDVSLVILDYDLPDLNGGAVAREMRQLKPHTPILMLSAQLFRPDGLDGEIDAYLTKCGSVKEFLEQIECLLSTKKSAQSDRIGSPALKRA
jgi:DNA-binding response OmpR family regulator